MVFDGTKKSCPNYDPYKKILNTSYNAYINPSVINKSYYGTEDFNKTCFNICPIKDYNGENIDATYIEDGKCKICYPKFFDELKEELKKELINKNVYQMCNIEYDEQSGGEMEGNTPIWFLKQQEYNLSKNNNLISGIIEGNIGLNNEEKNIPTGFIEGNIEPNNDNINNNNDISSINSFRKIISGLQYDTSFEQCINEKLSTDEDDDYEIQSRIANYKTVKEFNKKDINYIKRKLRNIINMKSDMVQECAELLNLGKSMCQVGIADKTLMIGKLIFSIVGNNKINIMETDGEEKYKINILINQLGPLIPKAVKNIIKVSKEYETRVCNFPSNTTLLLERIYDQTYDKQTNVSLDISPYFDFDSLIQLDGVTFVKTIVVLIVFAFLFMHAANLVIAFLSRGSTNSN